MTPDIDMTEYDDDTAIASQQQAETRRWNEESEALERMRTLAAQFRKDCEEFERETKLFMQRLIRNRPK